MSAAARPGIIAASRRRAGGGGTGYSAAVLADNPLLYVRFEETAGATCANDGSLAGSATASGTYTRNLATGLAGLGTGITLASSSNGGAGYPDTASLDITGNVTYECWINPTTLTTNHTLMTKGEDSASPFNSGYRFVVRADGSFRVQNSSVVFITTAAAVSTGGWWHCVFTRTSNTYEVFVNGASIGSNTNSTAITATSTEFSIGRHVTGTTYSVGFNGGMDEVAVYNTALSSTRIAAHYAARNT